MHLMRVLYWLLISVVALIGLIGVIAVVGLFLPRKHTASRAASFRAAPVVVYGVISDVARGAEWRPGITAIDMLSEGDQGVRFREHGPNGAITFRVEDAVPGKTFVTRIDDTDLAFGGAWTFALEPSGAGTSLTITEDGEIYNPIFRVLSRFFFSPTKTMEVYLAALKTRLGE
jgi:hypothetical protein